MDLDQLRALLPPRTAARIWPNDAGCWIYHGACTSGNYPTISVGGRTLGLHRHVFTLINGQPAGDVDHQCHGPGCPGGPTCPHRPCVRPDHLADLTRRANVLRGVGLAAVNARVTHCPAGHAYDEANTYRWPNGRRKCRRCDADGEKRRRLQLKG